MKMEILYPEVCNLYGDLMNIEYLSHSLPEADVVRTSLKTPPAFLTEDVDLINLCSMSEQAQELIVDTLRPYTDRIKSLIDSGTIFLVTGNAMEIFIRSIEKEDGSQIEMLGLFDLVAKRSMMNRYNALYLGKFDEIDIVGFKSQFTHAYGDDAAGLFQTLRGVGRNPRAMPEGIRKNNFMATYVLGPLIIMNPPFAKYIMGLLGAADHPLAFEAAAMDSYTLRLAEFSDPRRGFEY